MAFSGGGRFGGMGGGMSGGMVQQWHQQRSLGYLRDGKPDIKYTLSLVWKALRVYRWQLVFGTLVMILGAIAVSSAIASERELHNTNSAIERECGRYRLDSDAVKRAFDGHSNDSHKSGRAWWDWLILFLVTLVFVGLAAKARVPSMAMNFAWTGVLTIVLVASAAACLWGLWKTTRFS